MVGALPSMGSRGPDSPETKAEVEEMRFRDKVHTAIQASLEASAGGPKKP